MARGTTRTAPLPARAAGRRRPARVERAIERRAERYAPTWFRPAALERYSASSARANSSSGLSTPDDG